jgi:putative FmdB family regulatory protein
MPRYEYRCANCESIVVIAHASTEEVKECPKCSSINTLNKLVSTFMTRTKPRSRSVTGDVTENFIKDARSDLKQQKKELMKKSKS